MATHTQPKWYRRWRLWITDKSKGVNELLAALGEPLMRYATIYLALATGITYIKWLPAYTACQGIVISVPEFVILGALGVAEGACKEEHNKKWGIMLYGICALLAAIMIATFVDIFIYQFPDIAIKSLNFSRCIVAVGFSIVLGKLDQDPQHDQATQPAQSSPVPAAPPAIDLTPIHQALETLGTQIKQIAETQEQKDITLAGEIEKLTTSGLMLQELGEKIDTLETQIGTLSAHKNNTETDTPDDTEDDTVSDTETDTQEETLEHTNNITLLSSRRHKNDTRGDTKTRTTNSSDKASKAKRYIRKNPQITPAALAQKAEISVTYARRLLADYHSQVVNE